MTANMPQLCVSNGRYVGTHAEISATPSCIVDHRIPGEDGGTIYGIR